MTMSTTGANLRHILLTTQDVRLLEMFDGATLPPEPPPPRGGFHDFLVVNPWPEFTPEAAADAPAQLQPGHRILRP